MQIRIDRDILACAMVLQLTYIYHLLDIDLLRLSIFLYHQPMTDLEFRFYNENVDSEHESSKRHQFMRMKLGDGFAMDPLNFPN